MQVLDLPRSSVLWRIDLDELPPRTLSHRPPYPMNNSRIVLESRCTVTDAETGRTQWFVLGASCKTEQVGAAADLFLLPNADFMPILGRDADGEDAFMHLKTFARAGDTAGRFGGAAGEQQPDRLRVPIRGTFAAMALDLVTREAELLADARAIVEGTFSGDPLMAHSRIRRGRYTVTIEFPIKTMNANERAMIYQSDTGPVLYPDLDAPAERFMDRLDVAFAAHNAPDWIEFIVRRRTIIAEGVEVYHYSEPIRHDDVQTAVYRFRQDAPATTERIALGGTR
ncbi:MAG: hypothetical protein FJ038_03840 [Chloroflexi bacterium]|nr:hypothetical protein [Chloroflexota bacterium]